MTTMFISNSKLEEDKVIRLTTHLTGLCFYVGKHTTGAVPHTNSIICEYDEAEKLLEAALNYIRSRKNG
jgi:hypothetical protein